MQAYTFKEKFTYITFRDLRLAILKKREEQVKYEVKCLG